MSNPLNAVLSDNLKLNAKQLRKLGVVRDSLENSNCNRCNLSEARETFKPVAGEGRGRIFIVGHRIGKNEALTGSPAEGAQSKYGFEMMIDAFAFPEGNASYNKSFARDFALDYMFVSNAARCGHDINTTVGPTHWKKCAPLWLRQEIEIVDPVIIVFWNSASAATIIEEDYEIGVPFIGTVYGKKRHCFVMYHPVVIANEPTYEPIIRSQFTTLAQYMNSLGLLEGNFVTKTSKTEHKLVSTKTDLEKAVKHLQTYTELAIDTETGFDYQLGQSAKEDKIGALLWHHDNFRIVSVQICGLEKDNSVTTTYTIAVGFEDANKTPRQELTYKDVANALDKIFRGSAIQKLYTWNHSFDGPVLLRLGVDLMGVTHTDYEFTVYDGMLMRMRLSEHFASIQQLNLDSASKYYLHESKGGGFASYFEGMGPFQQIDIHDPSIQQYLLEYTGNDPRKTLLVCKAIEKELQQGVKSSESRSSIQTYGFGPLPLINPSDAESRLKDVTISIEHQMVPILSMMEMVGFETNSDSMANASMMMHKAGLKLLNLIRKQKPSFNPQSAAHVLDVIHGTLKVAAEETTAHNLQEVWDLKPKEKITVAKIEAAFNAVYGDLDAQQKTIEDKYFVWMMAVAQANKLEKLTQALKQTQSFLELVFLYKMLEKKRATYFERFQELAGKRSHFQPTYKLFGTTSGRLSGNFQNVPRGGEDDDNFIAKIHTHTGIDLSQFADVRVYLNATQPPMLNQLFSNMNLPWRINENDENVLVSADFAAQEDRMAFALTGDDTKERLLQDPTIDTHFYNAAYCFGEAFGFDVSTPQGVSDAYEYLTKHNALQAIEAKYKESGLEGEELNKKLNTDSEYTKLKKELKKTKSDYRTPMKTVHYAKQYGAGVGKLHMLLSPLFLQKGVNWSLEATQRLVNRYAELYDEVEAHRELIIANLDKKPEIEYPIFGTIRHAKNFKGNVQKGEYLSVANALNQGTSAYVTKLAMIRMRELILANAERWNLVEIGGDTYVGLVLQVHDEIGVLCPKRIAAEVALVLESAMKIIVGPGTNTHWDFEISDSKGKTGWLRINDPAFKSAVLFDAESEIKNTVAKSDKLPTGAPNILKDIPTITTPNGLIIANGHHSKDIF